MSFFPALAPSSRVYTPGDVPSARQQALSGAVTGYRLGNRKIAQTLQLVFSHLVESDMDLIKAHFIDRKGTFDIFYLPAEIWGDYAGKPPVSLLSNFAWRYIAEPTITDVSYDRFTVELDLQAIPINTGDLVFDGLTASATPARTYTLEAGGASATPARDYLIIPTGAA
jgi:hypothetical protein